MENIINIDKGEIIISVLFLVAMLFSWFYLEWWIKDVTKCTEGEHDWKFDLNTQGDTGDLGFGIKGYWNTNHYRCTKCGKERTEEIY